MASSHGEKDSEGASILKRTINGQSHPKNVQNGILRLEYSNSLQQHECSEQIFISRQLVVNSSRIFHRWKQLEYSKQIFVKEYFEDISGGRQWFPA